MNSIICPAKPSSYPQPACINQDTVGPLCFQPSYSHFLVGLIFFPTYNKFDNKSPYLCLWQCLSLRVVPESPFFLPLTQPSPTPSVWVTFASGFFLYQLHLYDPPDKPFQNHFLQDVPLIKNLKWPPTNLESNPISSLLGFQDSPYLVLSYLTNSVSHSSLPYTFCSIFPPSSKSVPQPEILSMILLLPSISPS